MIVYHGSYMEVVSPDTVHSRKAVDFGQGFYVTPVFEQACKWSDKFKRHGQQTVVSRYLFDESAYMEARCLFFDSYSEDWLDFILNCRAGHDTTSYEIISGGVANDKVFNTVELYFDGLIDKTEAIHRLAYEKPNMQICLRSQHIINRYLRFDGSEPL